MNYKYESEAMQVIHEDIKSMHELGIISDARMSEFDKMCVVQNPEVSYVAENSPKPEYSVELRGV